MFLVKKHQEGHCGECAPSSVPRLHGLEEPRGRKTPLVLHHPLQGIVPVGGPRLAN